MENHIVLPLRDLLLNKQYSVEKIELAFSKFKCPQETDLEDFLVNKAINYEKDKIGKTYLFINESDLKSGIFTIDAYVTLATKSVDITQMSSKMKRKMLGNYPGRDSISSVTAFLIGQLGRAEYCDKSQISGEDLLNESYSIFKQSSILVGGNVIVLECREHMYNKFYERHGFRKELNSDNLFELFRKANFDEEY